MTADTSELDRRIDSMIESRLNFYDYVEKMVLSKPNYVPGAHIKLMCDTIQQFLESEHRGLIVTTPPRHMRSTICSECLPAWFLSNDPEHREVMLASYNQTQARKMSRACRLRFDEEWHRLIFDNPQIIVDNADEIMLQGKVNGRPSLIAAGIGAGLTGSGADLLIVDDPIKDMEEAESETMRDKAYDWFQSVAMTRLSPKGKVLIVMTRWHHDDLVGRVLQDNPGGWEVLHLPAMDDRGEALWPERFPVAILMEKKQSLGSRVFEALYQGRPTPDEGGFFRREWFQVVERGFPDSAYRCRYWDKAATMGGGDWTTGVLLAMHEGRYCVEDVVHVQYGPKEVQDIIRRTAEQDGPYVRIRMEQEPGSSGVEVIDLYARRILQGYDFRSDKVTGPKELRAGPLSAALENGNVSIVRAQWNREYIQEFCEFPLGAHDDQVDATSGAFRELADAGPQHIDFF